MPKPEFKTEWESRAYDEAFEAMTALLNLSNTMGGQKAVVSGMLDAFVREHRTLQQSTIRNFVGFLTAWSQGEEGMLTDARNHDAWRFATKIREIGPGFASI